ncbi:hypothetical protein BGZ67_007793 [Mortierella alpina]|nr:hypothetical protein BGZ67_007793 [Mortierella alpina]
MFSWKKQNPPSQQRQWQQQQTLGDTEDYSDIVARGMRLANEDVAEGGEGDEDMDDYGGEDLGDIDLDDPDLLAELQGLTGEAPTPKATPAAQLSKPPQKAPAPAPQVAPVQARPAAAAKQTMNTAQASALQPGNQLSSNSVATPISLSGLGVDLEGVLDDGEDDEEVELTEDDWKDPHFLAQLQSLGGHTIPHDTEVQSNTLSIEGTATASAAKPATSSQVVTRNDAMEDYKPKSASSSMIAIAPRDDTNIDEDADGDTAMADHTAAPRSEIKPAKRLEEIPKTNGKDLLQRLQTREGQYKRAAVEAKRAGDMVLAGERLKTYKSLQAWIRLVEAGGFLDSELYPIPDEPSASTAAVKSDGDRFRAPASASAPAASAISPSKSGTDAPSSYAPPISSPAPEATTHVSSSIAEASADDLRSGSNVRGGGGIEFRQLAPDDDFQIVSSSGADTYDMLESQLESQIKMCATTCQYYYLAGDKQTALEFHKLNKTFKTDLVSLQSYRSHGKKAPAFHFQDVRFELEVGFYQEIGLNDLSLSIIRAWDLSHKDVQPSDIESYVVWDLGWPTENMAGAGSGKGTSPTVKKTPKPDFNYSKTLGIERSRAFQRFVERRKVTFEVWHYRGMLWKDYLLGRAQVPLQALLNHSEINEIIPLVDPTTRRNTGGKIEVRIRLQRPLLKPEIAVKEEKWLVIDEFNSGGLGFPSPISAAPAARLGGSPVSGRAGTPVGKTTKATAVASTSQTAPNTAPAISSPAAASVSGRAPTLAASKESPKPAASSGQQAAPSPAPAPAAPRQLSPAPGSSAEKAKPASSAPSPAAETEQDESASDKALNELNNVEILVSNTVLEHEIEEAQRLIHDAKAVGNNEGAEEYQDRLTQLEIKMKLLVLQVQTGQLTMEAYCQAVNARILKDKKLAIELKKLGMVPEAKRALARSKIMTQEMKEVEEAMAAQEDEEPGQDQGHAVTAGSNKRKISSKDITPAPNGQQHRQLQQPQSKYIEFQHAFEHSTRQARQQDDTKRTFTENGHQRQVKRLMDSPHGNSGSQDATGQFQDKGVRLGRRANPLQDFDNNHSSDRPSRGREQFSHQPQKGSRGHRRISPVSNARTQQRSDATQERPRHGYRAEPSETSSARSPLPSNGESEAGAQSWNRLHPPPVTSAKTNEVLTIRDILDSQEIRNQISELRRSLNSNADHHQVPRTTSRQNEYLNAPRAYEDTSSAISAVSAAPKRSRTEQRLDEPAKNEAARTKAQGEGTTTDLSMDESLLEKKFRKRLDAAIPIMGTPRTGLSRTTLAVGPSAKESITSMVAIPTDFGDVNGRPVVATKQRQDLYHSSYSPTEFSDVEDQDNEDEDEDEDQDTVELKRPDASDKHTDQSHPLPSERQPASSQTQAREGLWASNTAVHRHKPSFNPVRATESRGDNPRRDSGEISFEREVALARAKRELGASLNREGSQQTSEKPKSDGIHPSINQSNIPSSPVLSVSRLDRGRDLALEDLVSPTRFNFGSRHSSQQHQYDPTAPAGFSSAAPTASGHDWRSAPTFPLLSTAEDLAQLDIATRAEDRFLEMAGTLGEGQAVASVLGTLKGMIRQLKTEKKLSEKAIQKLQKELRKAQRDLERSRKANEKLPNTDHATPFSSHTKPGRGNKDQEEESISAQQERDKIARNMVAFQKRIDVLEMQRAELQMREQIRAKEEADLLLLVDSDDDSEQGGGSESGSDSGGERVESDAGDHSARWSSVSAFINKAPLGVIIQSGEQQIQGRTGILWRVSFSDKFRA